MRSRRLFAAVALLLLLAAACVSVERTTSPPTGAATPATPATPSTDGAPAEIMEMERAIAAGVNEEREAEGLEPLEWREDLAVVARQYSERMLEEGFFAHVAPAGDDVADRVREAGITFTAVGENIYRGEGPVDHVETSVSGWMQSPGHRENILREVFTQTGVGMARDGDTAIVTQVFLTP